MKLFGLRFLVLALVLLPSVASFFVLLTRITLRIPTRGVSSPIFDQPYISGYYGRAIRRTREIPLPSFYQDVSTHFSDNLGTRSKSL